MIRALPVVLAACSVAPDDQVSSVSYLVRWDDTGVVRQEDGWSVDTDLGYRVTVTEGWVVEHTVTLVPCASHQASGGLWSVIGGVAYAAHAVPEDPSKLERQRAASLMTLAPEDLGAQAFAPGRYCDAFWLVGRASRPVPGEAARPEAGTSLHLAGRWRRGDQTGHFDYTTSWTQGRHHSLSDAVGQGPALTVAITRQARSLFDGVDFAQAEELVSVWQILLNLTEDTRVQVSRGMAP